jgi:hypothetical protein
MASSSVMATVPAEAGASFGAGTAATCGGTWATAIFMSKRQRKKQGKSLLQCTPEPDRMIWRVITECSIRFEP